MTLIREIAVIARDRKGEIYRGLLMTLIRNIARNAKIAKIAKIAEIEGKTLPLINADDTDQEYCQNAKIAEIERKTLPLINADALIGKKGSRDRHNRLYLLVEIEIKFGSPP